MSKKTWFILSPFIMGAMIFIDQITKYMANRDLADGDFVIIDKVLRLSLTHNKGAAWGMLQGKVNILSIITVALSIFLIYFFAKIPEGKKYGIMRFLTLSVIAGSIGNLIDRAWAGEVTDFVYIELIDFPKFNVADCFITWAMVLLVILMIFYYKDEDLEFIGLDSKKKAKSSSNNEDVVETVNPAENINKTKDETVDETNINGSSDFKENK